MAYKVTKQSGNWNTGTTWNSLLNTPIIGTGYDYTSGSWDSFSNTFTAPNTTDTCLGVAVFNTAWSQAGGDDILYAKLQIDDGLGNWSDVGSVVEIGNTVIVNTTEFWVYLEGINYQFTTTAADRYRFVFKDDNMSPRLVVEDSSTSNGPISVMIVTDTDTTVPGSSDQAFVFHDVDVDADINLGGTATERLPATQSQALLNSLYVGNGNMSGATLQFPSDIGYNVTTTSHIYINGNGRFNVGTDDNRLDSGQTMTFTFNNTTDERAGITLYRWGEVNLFGMNRFDETVDDVSSPIIISGLGTTTSPLVVSGDTSLWQLNDPVVIEAHEYGDVAKKYIRTIASNSITLSDTSGGVESGLAGSDYSAINGETCMIHNVWKNIIFADKQTNNHIIQFYLRNEPGHCELKGIHVGNNMMEGIHDCAIYISSYKNNIVVKGLFVDECTETSITLGVKNCQIDDVISWNANTTSSNGRYNAYINTSVNSQFHRLYMISGEEQIMRLNISSNNKFKDCRLCGIRDTGEPFQFQVSHGNEFIGMQMSALRGNIIYNNSDNFDNKFIDCTIGMYGVADVSNFYRIGIGYITENIFENCHIHNDLLTTKLWYGNTDWDCIFDAASGTRVGFQYCNDTEDVLNYLPEGTIEKTGLDSLGNDLSDNTVSPIGKNCIKFTPIEGALISWDFLFPQKAGEDVYIYSQQLHQSANANSYMDGTLTLYGGTEPAAELKKYGEIPVWTSGSMKATPTDTYDALASIKFQLYSEDGLSSLYISDIKAGTNIFTDFSVWDNALPSPVMADLANWSPDAVWDALATNVFAENSFGRVIKSQLFQENGVWLDPSSSFSGTSHLIGSRDTPVNNLPDAITIAKKYNTNVINMAGINTATEDISGLDIRGWQATGWLNLNNQLCELTVFRQLNILGQQASFGVFEECRFNATFTGMLGMYKECLFVDSTTPIEIQSHGTWSGVFMDGCRSAVPGTTSPVFDYSAGGILMNNRAYSGGLRVINSTDSGNTSTIEFIAGKFNFEDTNTEGIFEIRGVVDTSNIDVTTNAQIGFVGSIQTIREQVYDNKVYLDVSSTSGSTSTNKYPFGTIGQPCNNLSDIIDLCDEYNISTIMLAGDLTLDQNVSGREFISWKNGKIDMNSQLAIATRFRELKVYGQQASLSMFYDCRIDSLTEMEGIFNNCNFLTTSNITFATGQVQMYDCKTQGGSYQEFSLPNPNSFVASNGTRGRFKITSCTEPSCMVAMQFDGGQIALDSGVTAGMYMISGIFSMDNNSSGGQVLNQPVAMQQDTNNMIIGNS